jgi:hypothetical protein
MSIFLFRINQVQHAPKGSLFFEFRYGHRQQIQHKWTQKNSMRKIWEIEIENLNFDQVQIVAKRKKFFQKKVEVGFATIKTSFVHPETCLCDWIIIRKHNPRDIPLIIDIMIHHNSNLSFLLTIPIAIHNTIL